MQIKPLLTILFCSLLISCSDPGEEYVTVSSRNGSESVVKINSKKWNNTRYGGWDYSIPLVNDKNCSKEAEQWQALQNKIMVVSE